MLLLSWNFEPCKCVMLLCLGLGEKEFWFYFKENKIWKLERSLCCLSAWEEDGRPLDKSEGYRASFLVNAVVWNLVGFYMTWNCMLCWRMNNLALEDVGQSCRLKVEVGVGWSVGIATSFTVTKLCQVLEVVAACRKLLKSSSSTFPPFFS